ncbi:MAG: D-alanyl-D-alanine carboxypeptidase/D-alanyl-D-alanine-endopeptidase [Betaproteobacteria bacterium]
MPGALPDTVVAKLRASGIPEDALGAIVVRVSDGAVRLSHHADASLQPASTLKLLTSIVSLERLGPTYRGRTELRTAARDTDGTLEGDLVLRGMADPDLDWMSFRTMLQTVRNKGIRRINGDLVIDRNLFNPSRVDIGLPPFDETPEFRYNVIPDALMLNTNLLEFTLVSRGDSLSTSMIPALDGVSVISNLTFIDRACVDWEDGWKTPQVNHAADGSLQIVLIGEFPRNCTATTDINVIERTEYAERMFRTFWRELGGEWRGRVRESGDRTAGFGATPGDRLLAIHRARTMAEVTRNINKRSDNPIARLTFLTLGATGSTAGSQAQDGVTTALQSERIVREWLAQHNIGGDGLILENGSGLSRKERIKPEQLAAVLGAAYRSYWAPEFQATLPIVGVDAAMEKRLRDSPAAKRGRIKTGSLRNVSAVAGYVPDSNDDVCIVVAIINHDRGSASVSAIAKPVLDEVIDWTARSGSPSR